MAAAVILFAGILAELIQLGNKNSISEIEWFAAVAALSMLVAGSFYIASHERLDYADLSSGELYIQLCPL